MKSRAAADYLQRVLVTGGAGFIGGAVRRLLADTNAEMFNLDECGYASDLTSINVLSEAKDRHQLLRVDLADAEATAMAVRQADPDLVLHLAAESHVDRSIAGAGTIHKKQCERHPASAAGSSQPLGSYARAPSQRLPFPSHKYRRGVQLARAGGSLLRDHSLRPRSPFSASKAANDHLVRTWHHTYGLPVVLTNCSNNYGPWQYPEKLIPVAILKAAAGESILYTGMV